MPVRYLSYENTIAAAGAAFACPDDDYSDLARARSAAANASGFRFRIKRAMRKLLAGLKFVHR